MLIELAIGDAYGCGFEYASENLHLNNLSGYVKHPRHSLYAGQYSDDTQMSLAIAELMIEGGEWETNRIIDKFIEVFKRDPRDGYSRGFQAILESINTREDFLYKVIPNSDKSGGAMRAGCCGLASTIDEVIRRATIQAAITHNTPAGKDAAVAAALMVHYFLYDVGEKAFLGSFIERLVPGDYGWDMPWEQKIGSKGWMDVRAAITAIKQTNTLADCLKWIVGLGGDVDTAGAITMIAASCSKEMGKNLPEVLFSTLENGKYGRDYIQHIDNKLFNMRGKV